MQKKLISLIKILLISWLQEGLLIGLGLYLPLVASVIALIHLYRLPNRWLITFFIGMVMEISSGGLSGELLGLLAVGLFCQTLFSIISHAHDRFYVVVVGSVSVLIGELISRLSVNFITNNFVTNSFEVQELTFARVILLISSAMIILYLGKKIIQPRNKYV